MACRGQTGEEVFKVQKKLRREHSSLQNDRQREICNVAFYFSARKASHLQSAVQSTDEDSPQEVSTVKAKKQKTMKSRESLSRKSTVGKQNFNFQIDHSFILIMNNVHVTIKSDLVTTAGKCRTYQKISKLVRRLNEFHLLLDTQMRTCIHGFILVS